LKFAIVAAHTASNMGQPYRIGQLGMG
jgi:hypothetical protein